MVCVIYDKRRRRLTVMVKGIISSLGRIHRSTQEKTMNTYIRNDGNGRPLWVESGTGFRMPFPVAAALHRTAKRAQRMANPIGYFFGGKTYYAKDGTKIHTNDVSIDEKGTIFIDGFNITMVDQVEAFKATVDHHKDTT